MGDLGRERDDGARRPLLGWPAARDAGLLTDLYELTMAQSYWRLGMNEVSTFELFVRESPPNRRFFVAAGLEQSLAALEAFRFDADAREYLRSLGRFDPAFVEWLGSLRFRGEVRAMPEGEIAFPTEPLLQITAPLIEAQVVESILLNTLLHPTAVASKAARCVLAAQGRPVVDFSLRRDHGAAGAIAAARAAYLTGCEGTSNLLAGRRYGIPVFGTMAHSYVMAFESEQEAFRAFADEFPESSVLLIDTYDTLEGARRAAWIGREMAARGRALRGVRIDSGNVAALAADVRRILDGAGLREATIFVSGDLNEWRISELLGSGAPVDAFGVGTDLGTSRDAPALGGVYKLAAYAGRGVAKRSPEKATLPGRKQVWRHPGFRDTLALDEERTGGEPLLGEIMRGGRATAVPSLDEARARCRERLGVLPPELRDLAPCAEGSAPLAALSPRLRAAAEDAGATPV